MEAEQTHGHEIIDIVCSHPEGISRKNLADVVSRQFGRDAHFFTCSAENMCLGDLLSFLADRGKIEVRDDLVFPGGSKACNH